jgi:adenylate cyclase
LHNESDDSLAKDLRHTMDIAAAARGKQILLSKPLVENLRGKQAYDLVINPVSSLRLDGGQNDTDLFEVKVPGLEVSRQSQLDENGIPTIAVLPFHNLTSDSRDDYLGLGIAEEIIKALDKNPDIKVIARATTFGVNPMLKIQDLGKLLNASVILDGTVKKAANEIFISVELTDIDSGKDLWVEEFKRNAEDIIVLQDEITDMLLKTLTKHGATTEGRNDIREVQTENPEAYDAFLRGNRFYYQFSVQSIQFARRMFQQALQLDRKYALAHCGLANCYSYLYMHHSQSNENLSRAEQYGKKAVELNPALAACHAAHGLALSLSSKYEASEAAFEKALELDPLLFEAHYQYGRMEFSRGNLEKAVEHYDYASHIRQDDYQSLLLMGQCFDSLSQASEAIQTRQRGVQIAEEVLQLNPGDVRALYMAANGLVALGGYDNQQKGLEFLKRAFTLDPQDPMLLYNAGCIYSLCKMKNEALNCLEQAVSNGLTQKAWYQHDSNLDPLRAEPRFIDLLESL